MQLGHDVAVDRKPVRPHRLTALFLPESGDRRHEQHRHGEEEGEDGAPCGGKHIRASAEPFLQGRTEHLQQQRDHHQQRDEEEIDQPRIDRQFIQLVQLQRNAGIEHDAAECQEGIGPNAGDREHDQYRTQIEQYSALVLQGAAIQVPADNVGREHQQDDADVDDEHRSQRIEETAVGIDCRREHFSEKGRPAATEIQPQGRSHQDRHHDRITAKRLLALQEEQRSQGEEAEREPDKHRTLQRVTLQRFGYDLENGLAAEERGGAAAVGKRADRIPGRQFQVAVDRIGQVGIELVADLQASDDLRIVPDQTLDQIPPGAHADQGRFGRHGGQGRLILRLRVGEHRIDEPVGDVVILERKLVAPRAQGVPDILVDDHVFGKPGQLQPAFLLLREGLTHIAIQDPHTLVQPAAQRTGLSLAVDHSRTQRE